MQSPHLRDEVVLDERLEEIVHRFRHRAGRGGDREHDQGR